MAWAAPLSPVINKDRALSLENVCFEAGVADVLDKVATHKKVSEVIG
jgi:hypothetical protein